jgi:tetratricopeptide (TPR) repeat protein
MRRQVLGYLVALALIVAAWPLTAAAEPTRENPETAEIDPDYSAGKIAIEAKNWDAAIRSLWSASLRDPGNADIQNYLGYAYRKSGQLYPALAHYRRALELNPRHRGAHEYVGEAYLMMNALPKAEEHLAALRTICLIPCDEYEHLKKAIDDYQRRVGSR